MTEVNLSFPDFSAGEISPDLYGRFDLRPYYKSGRKVENFIVQATGMARYRTGTKFVAKTRMGREARLHRFDLTDSFSYILEFTDSYLRFHRNGAQVKLPAQGITSITQADPAVVTYTGADVFSNGDSVFITGVGGMVQVNDDEYQIANVNTGAKTFQLVGVDSALYAAYTSGGTVEKIYEVATPYTINDIFQLTLAQQTGTIIYIAHENHAPRKLEVTSATNWTLSTHDAIRQSFAASQIITAITNANPAVVTYGGSDTYTNGDTVRLSGITGMIELNDEEYEIAGVNTTANTFQLVGVDSTGFATYASGGVIRRVDTAPAPFLVADEYPRAVGFYEQRLIYGGSKNAPATLYFSRSAEPDDFTFGDEVDDGIEYTIAGGVGRVQWLRGTERFLGIGGASDILQATGGIDGVITPTSISIRPSNSQGATNQMPIGQGTQIFFVESNQLTVRSFEYDFQRDSYTPIDRNLLASHITKSGVKQIDYSIGRPSVLWAVRNDGVLIGLTNEESEAIPGWHKHLTNGHFSSVAVEARDRQYDAVWFSIKRGNDHYIEYFSDYAVLPRREDYITGNKASDTVAWQNELWVAQNNYIHVDSALSYYGDNTGLEPDTNLQVLISGADVVINSNKNIFTSNDIGRQIWLKDGGRFEIAALLAANSVEADIIEPASFSSQTFNYGEWYITTDRLSGLRHLEGREVTVVADGGQHDNHIVQDGIIMLSRQVAVCHAGLPYTGYLETNDLEGGGMNGTAQTKRKVVTAVGFKFLDTLYAKFGTSYYKLNQIEIRTAAMRMDRPPEPFTGDTKEVYANDITDARDGGWGRSKRAIVVQDLPYPCNLQLIVPYMTVSN